MRVLITIGWQKYLLQNDTEAARVVKTMAKALPVKYWFHGQPIQVDDKKGNEFCMEYVPDDVEIIGHAIVTGAYNNPNILKLVKPINVKKLLNA